MPTATLSLPPPVVVVDGVSQRIGPAGGNADLTLRRPPTHDTIAVAPGTSETLWSSLPAQPEWDGVIITSNRDLDVEFSAEGMGNLYTLPVLGGNYPLVLLGGIGYRGGLGGAEQPVTEIRAFNRGVGPANVHLFMGRLVTSRVRDRPTPVPTP